MEKLNHLTTPADLTRSSNTIADIGEIALIERLKAFCAKDAIGDDAAIMSVAPEHKLVVTTDMLTENVHFSGQTTPPYSVGWRAVAANLADIAAMGAEPLGITVGLGLPGHTPWPWVEELYRGMEDCLKAYGGAIHGGDLCRSMQRTVSITALGQVRLHQVISRSTATPGMTVIATGPHGASRAGLALLLEELELSGKHNPNSPMGQAKAWVKAHQLPIPRFDALDCLRRLISEKRLNPYPTITGMDSSDGLANALLQISGSSRVGMDIVRSRIPLPTGLEAAVGYDTAIKWALHGGEDFELVFCLPPELAEAFTQTPFATAIGTTTDTGIVKLMEEEGSHISTRLSHESFQHF
ncbi:MAG: thiamine-phosphate kinase [Cyanobacteria bacterium J06649_5]